MRMSYISSLFDKLHSDVLSQIKIINKRSPYYIKKEISNLNNHRQILVKSKIFSKDDLSREFINQCITETDDQLLALRKRLKYLTRPKDKKQVVSISDIKSKIKIKDILVSSGIKIERGNFFKLRDERTPSCQFNDDLNLYYDFGAAKGGSVIDLYMVIHNCNNIEAIKNLSSMCIS